MTAEEELKNLIKNHTKKEKKSLFIRIRVAKDIKDLKMKNIKKGLIELRVHSTADGFPKWYLHGYLIDLKYLSLHNKKFKKSVLQTIFLNPRETKISQTATDLIEELHRDYGDILPLKGKLQWKTEKFKKSKDPFKRVYKTM